MPRRYFRRISRAYRLNDDAWYARPFRNLPGRRTAFAVTRPAVAGGIWLGLLIAFLPFPGHTVAAIVGALLFRTNLPATVAAMLVNNPLTMVPIYSLNYFVGAWILGMPPEPLAVDEGMWDRLFDVGQVWQPLWLGSVMLGVLVATIGYAIVSVAWRMSVHARLRRRIAARNRSGG